MLSSEKPIAGPGERPTAASGSPTLVLITVDVDRGLVEHAQQHVTRPGRELTGGQADRGAAVTAAAGLMDHQRAVARRQALEQLEHQRRRADASLAVSGHLLEESERLGVIADEQALRLCVVVEHHAVVLAPDT